MAKSIAAFREQYVQSDWADPDSYEGYEGRKLRYQILWAWYESTAFRDLHKWAKAYRNSYQLYKYIRNLYNPAFRLVEFWKTMVWGGLLDPEAKEAGSIPIKTDLDELRPAIAQLWKASNWDINKDITVLWACSMGDVCIRIVDDPDHEEVRIENVHPASIKELIVDARGYVKQYQIEETRIRPDNNKYATYLEIATREDGSDTINFETKADGKPFAWNGETATWSQEYGFMPLVAVQHNNVGFAFGWPEVHPLRSKMNGVDDLASKLHDYIRKVIDPVWLFNFGKPKTTAKTTMESETATSDRSAPGREEMPALYVSDPTAKGQALVTSEISIAETSAEIQNLLSEMERDMPELQMDIWTVGQDVSGKALGKARQRVERKVIQRRPNYDKALVRAHQMAIAIGGFKGYKGYEGYSLDSYDAGKLEHTIPSDRTIFEADPFVNANEKRIMWETIARADTAGIPPEIVLKDFGWNEKQITEFKEIWEKYKADQEAKKQAELEAITERKIAENGNNSDDTNKGGASNGMNTARNKENNPDTGKGKQE